MPRGLDRKRALHLHKAALLQGSSRRSSFLGHGGFRYRCCRVQDVIPATENASVLYRQRSNSHGRWWMDRPMSVSEQRFFFDIESIHSHCPQLRETCLCHFCDNSLCKRIPQWHLRYHCLQRSRVLSLDFVILPLIGGITTQARNFLTCFSSSAHFHKLQRFVGHVIEPEMEIDIGIFSQMKCQNPLFRRKNMKSSCSQELYLLHLITGINIVIRIVHHHRGYQQHGFVLE